jgi:uncharacterized protein YndB with AHSA1/START domain
MTDAIKEVSIKASPSTIFPFLTDPAKFLLWMGTDVKLNPVPGGEFRVLCQGVHPSAGTFLEIVENQKVVFTFGWDEPNHPIPAGSTTVEITLTPEGDSTLVRLTHRGLPEDALSDHLDGWGFYLNRLKVVVSGGDPGPYVASLENVEG